MQDRNNRLFEDISRIAGGALGAAGGVKADVEALVRTQAAKLIDELDLVRREDFEAARDMASKARLEQEAMAERMASLEARLEELQSKINQIEGSYSVSPQESSDSPVET